MRGSDPSRYLEWLRGQTAPVDDSRPAGIEALEETLSHPRLLIVGDAGCGKTTFLRHVAFLWCCGLQDARTWSLLFPIFINLSELAAHIGGCEFPDGLIDFLGTRSRDLSWGLHRDFFREKLSAALVLLDGLNEAPAAARLIEDTATANPQSRFVVTTRPLVHSAEEILAGFHRVQVEPAP